jgi:hypothetical protein
MHANNSSFILLGPKILFLGIMVLSLVECKKTSPEFYQNPDFDCPTSAVVEYSQGIPYPRKGYPHAFDGHKYTVAELRDFCSRMSQRFAVSNVTSQEAKKLFKLFAANSDKVLPDRSVLSFKNECYAMPPCALEPFIMEKQVKLLKVTNDEYEVFYYYIFCGTNFIHMQVNLEHGKIQGIQPIESWAESCPC